MPAKGEWEYTTIVKLERVRDGEKTLVDLPVVFRGPAGRIYDRETIIAKAKEGANEWEQWAQATMGQRGHEYQKIKGVRIIAVTWIPNA